MESHWKTTQDFVVLSDPAEEINEVTNNSNPQTDQMLSK